MSKYKYDKDLYDFTNKEQSVADSVVYMLNRTQSMFRWHNLPKSIPQRSLELFLQTNGHVFIMKHGDYLCVYTGGLGGEPDYLYRPTVYTIANPAQKFSGEFKIDEDGVIILNDSMCRGLLPMFRKYASLMTENELSIWLADIEARAPWAISAEDDKALASANEFIADLIKGKIGTIKDSAFLESLKTNQLTSTQNTTISTLIELEQYLKASWFTDLGLNANYNGMKKEAISDSEKSMSQDVLLPLIDDMLKERQEACERINEMFGTDIWVEFASAWEDNKEEIELEHDVMEAEADNATEDGEDDNIDDTDTVNDGGDEMEETEEEPDEETIEETVEEIKETVEEILEEVTEEEEEENDKDE